METSNRGRVSKASKDAEEVSPTEWVELWSGRLFEAELVELRSCSDEGLRVQEAGAMDSRKEEGSE